MIFVYGNVIDIYFRMDEKCFDVDGVYNIWYEIIKKWIDKVLIIGINERFRLLGMILIVYINDKDCKEYLEYFEFFIVKGWLVGEVEDLILVKL